MLTIIGIFFLIGITFLLIGLPLTYYIWRGNFWRTVMLTWLIWILYGFSIPAQAKLYHMLTGEHSDFNGTAFLGGVLFGWFPGLVIASIGPFVYDLIRLIKKMIVKIFKQEEKK